MIELITWVSLAIVGALAVNTMQRGRPPEESRIVWVGFAAHLVASVCQVLITVYWYAGGDVLYYAAVARHIGALLDLDFATYGWELARIFVHQDGMVPVEIIGEGDATGAMIVLVGLVLYALGGSLYAGCLLLSIASLLSRVLIMRVLLASLPDEHHRLVRYAAMLVPSVTFWGAGIAKETVALIGLGLLLWGTARVFGVFAPQRGFGLKRLLALWPMLVGGVFVWAVKPYIFVAFWIAASLWWYVLTMQGGRVVRVRWTHIGAGAIISATTVLLIGRITPEYSLDSVAERAALLQASGVGHAGGSTYSLGNTAERSFAGQLAFAPIGMIYALFRPFLFESSNLLMFINSLETTFVTFLFARAAYRSGFRRLADALQRWPIIAFSAAFVLVLSAGVGISTSNLGTLTRYRMPMVTFYVLLVALWDRLGAPAPAVRALLPTLPGRRRRAIRT